MTDWTTGEGYKNYCGRLEYMTEFELGKFKNVSICFSKVCEMLSLCVNENEMSPMMLLPYEADIAKHLKKRKNEIRVRVTNSAAMRFFRL